jgi:hypothetical protein
MQGIDSMSTDNTTPAASPLIHAPVLLDALHKTRASHREHQAALAPLEAAAKASADARAEVEARRVLAQADGDVQGARVAASDLKTLAAAEAKDRAALEDARRITAALRDRVIGLEAELQSLRPGLHAAVVEHQQDVLRGLQAELERAVQPLIVWAHRAARVAIASGVRIEDQLHRLLVPNLTEITALAGWGSASGAAFGTVDDGVPLPDELSEPLNVLAAVTGYRTLAESDAAVAFEVVHPQAGEATRRAIEARNAARAAELVR